MDDRKGPDRAADPVRLLLVEDDAEILAGVVAFLDTKADIEIVGQTDDGRQALEMMERLKPDVILLDMVINGIDGWDVLREMQRRGLDRSRVIVTTGFSTAENITLASRYGVASYLLKPSYEFEALHRRILDVGRGLLRPEAARRQEPTYAPPPASDSMEAIGATLLLLGMSPRVKGFHYLTEAVHAVLRHPHLLSRLTLELYPQIAEGHATQAGNVERAIRHAIERCWTRTSQEKLDRVFGPGVCGHEQRPSNGELIALLAGHQRQRAAGA